MNALILNSETISKLFLMKALTFFNFKETVIYSLSKNLYLEQLNISYIEIKKTDNINYDDYDLVICDTKYSLIFLRKKTAIIMVISRKNKVIISFILYIL